MPSPSRRHFVQTSAAAGAAILTGAPSVQALGALDKLNVGLIGCGNRGKTIIREVLKLKHELVAICDVAKFRYDDIHALLPMDADKPKEYREFGELLRHKGLDAVVIATPDHHHREQLIAAVNAGKDVYIEKPLSKTIEEGKEMIEAVRKNKRIVQVGNQRHSGPHWKRCREAIDSNDFGDLIWVKVWDCRNWLKRDPFEVPKWFTADHPKEIDWDRFLGNALKREFNSTRYFSWRWFWDYAGGLMTDIGAHQLDIVQWLGGVDVPKSVVANGGRYHFKHWETPDVIHGVWDYGKFTATFNVEFVNGADGVGAAFYGTKQTLIADATKEIKVYNTIDKITEATKPVQTWEVVSEVPMHVKNWLDCCISRKEPNSPVELGHRVILAAHLANLSYRTGKRIHWDADRQEIIGS